MRLILASASPRRAELLRAAGYEFEAVPADVDETVRDGEPPAAYVRRLAAEKSFVASGLPSTTLGAGSRTRDDGPPEGGHYVRNDGPPEGGHYVRNDGPPEGGHYVQHGHDVPVILGADTAVVVDGEILGKPRDDRDAAAMLRRLSGRRHEVLTGVSLRRGAFELGRVETTAVHVVALSADDIAWYVASGEGRDKAGAYAIQGLASRLITSIEGSYSNVVGLPVTCVRQLLREYFGVQPALRRG